MYREMQVKLLREVGIEEALYGLGLSFGITSNIDFVDFLTESPEYEHMEFVANKLAGKGLGHDKFLRMITVYLGVNAPLYWWKEFDTYKVGTVAQSESTMHTINKTVLTNKHFALDHSEEELHRLNAMAKEHKVRMIPVDFMQKRIVMCNYAVLQNILRQRNNHYLREWYYFIHEVLEQVNYPEWINRI